MRLLFVLLLPAVMWSCAAKDKNNAGVKTPNTPAQDTIAVDTLDEAAQDLPLLGFEGQKWTLHAMTQDGQTTKLVKDSRITLELNRGKVSGMGGCNIYNGAYTATEEGAIRFSGIVSTERLCAGLMGQEARYLEMLQQSETWKKDRVELKITTPTGSLSFFNNIPEPEK